MLSPLATGNMYRKKGDSLTKPCILYLRGIFVSIDRQSVIQIALDSIIFVNYIYNRNSCEFLWPKSVTVGGAYSIHPSRHAFVTPFEIS